ncbi:unnamed protein product [Rangifer tarandus platyrhynchus]|uniref:Uncharacterized protein n=1 Tax=Rangifer tarandus platyrhynchus TaxID=3082113 RepID=A0AC60A8U5_RANTA
MGSAPATPLPSPEAAPSVPLRLPPLPRLSPPYPSPGWAETWSRGGALRGTGAEDRPGTCGLLGAARSRPAPRLRHAPRSGRVPLGRS